MVPRTFSGFPYAVRPKQHREQPEHLTEVVAPAVAPQQVGDRPYGGKVGSRSPVLSLCRLRSLHEILMQPGSWSPLTPER